MEIKDTYKLENNTPVKLADNRFGMLIRYPHDSPGHAMHGLCGIQVPGEPDVRWVSAASLVLDGMALVETPNA